MNYVLILINYSPEYLKYVLNSILSVDKDAEIFVCSNKKVEYKNTKFINLDDISSRELQYFKDLNIYKNTPFAANPLWMTSALRIFYLNEIVKLLNPKPVIHFDNDVLIYKPFSQIITDDLDDSKLNITPASLKQFVFGYSFINNNYSLEKICEEINKLADYGNNNKWSFNSGKPFTEMQFLSNIYKQKQNTINLLPTLPYHSKVIFDPANYGQYFDGTHVKPRRRYEIFRNLNLNLNIDVEIKTKRIKPVFQNNSPYVIFNQNKFELVNLHIHSKRFQKFLPREYSDYV